MSEAPHTGDGLTADYWQGAERGELVLQRCARCGRVRHYPQVLCDACYCFDVEPMVASGRGVVHSWTIAHHAFDPAFASEVPYVLVTVDMQEGVRVLGRLPDPTGLQLGLPVQLAFEADASAYVRPVFRHRPDAGTSTEG